MTSTTATKDDKKKFADLLGKTDVSRFQTEFNKRVGQGFTLKVDGKLGEQTKTAAVSPK